MSKQENRKMISAYEKMLVDGTAFKEVDLTMHTQPDAADIEGMGASSPLGEHEPINENDNNIVEDDGYGEFDSIMEQKMNKLRQKAGRGGTSTGGGGNPSKELMGLKKRVAKLEEAMILIMETQTTLIEGG
jgi:hypothetical protein